jgi:hypothetical protein
MGRMLNELPSLAYLLLQCYFDFHLTKTLFHCLLKYFNLGMPLNHHSDLEINCQNIVFQIYLSITFWSNGLISFV